MAIPLTLSVPVPSVLLPSLKVTVPVAVPEPGALAVTVAVNVTDCPKTDGLTLETTEVVISMRPPLSFASTSQKWRNVGCGPNPNSPPIGDACDTL